MPQQPLTIVIPAYRAEKYLVSAVESALRCAEANVLISDNRSTDSTLAIARRYEADNPGRVRVVARVENLGLAGNFQRSVELVETPYFVNIGADDIVSPSYFREAIGFLDANPAVGMVGAPAQEIGPEDLIDGTIPADLPIAASDFKILEGMEGARLAIVWSPYMCSPATVFRTKAWQEIGGYDTSLAIVLDRELWFRISLKNSVGVCGVPGIYYRIHPTQESRRSSTEDLWSYELSRMFRGAKRMWPQRELRPLFRAAFRKDVRIFFGSSYRALKGGRFGQVIPRMAKGFGEMLWWMRG